MGSGVCSGKPKSVDWLGNGWLKSEFSMFAPTGQIYRWRNAAGNLRCGITRPVALQKRREGKKHNEARSRKPRSLVNCLGVELGGLGQSESAAFADRNDSIENTK